MKPISATDNREPHASLTFGSWPDGGGDLEATGRGRGRGAQKTGTTTHGTVCVAIVAMATVPEEVKGRERLVHTMPSRIDYLRMFRHIRRCTEVLHGFFVLYQELSMLRSPQSIALYRRRSQIDGVHRRVYDPSIKRIFFPNLLFTTSSIMNPDVVFFRYMARRG